MLCFFLPIAPWITSGQEMMRNNDGGSIHLLTDDLATLESRDQRRDLSCTIEPSKPVLGFDLKFHAGFAVSLPFHELTPGDRLTVIFRVAPVDQHERVAIHFHQRIFVPEGNENA